MSLAARDPARPSVLARFLGKDDAILYSSCWDANGGLFETILTDEDAILSDEGLRSLRGLVNLEWLDLGGTRITDAGVAHLHGMTRLKKLNCQGAALTDEGVRHLADMANLEQVLTAWVELEDVLGDDPENSVMPVTYMNSAADLKAFVGEHGGTVCTSSNADGALKWSFAQREKVFFFPDQHLGRNTGKAMGIPL